MTVRWPCAGALGALVLSTGVVAQPAPGGAASPPPPAAPQAAEAPSATASNASAAAQARAVRAQNVSSDAAAHAAYWVPAVEILGFQVLVNRVNDWWGSEREDYRVTLDSIRTNLHSGWHTDDDPFETNQLGHPVQGAMYHGIARSLGFDYWHSLGFTFAGSAVWEIAGERTHPSRNDQVASGIGGSFLGEALFRMSNLVLEQGGGLSRVWREVAAAVIDPPVGFNRLVFDDRFGIYSSRGAAYFSRLSLGYAGSVKRDVGPSGIDVKRNEAQLDFAIDYGLPGATDYRYARPFDYFNFQGTLSSANGVENVLTRGLLLGRTFEASDSWRGVWGLYGSYDYIAPQTFRVSTTALSVGATAQGWIGQDVSLQGTGLIGAGYAAVGTTRGTAGDRDYNYGVAPQALLNVRAVWADKLALDVTGREYFVSGVASGTGGGHDNILRGDALLTWRLAKQHAISLRLVGSRRDATFANPGSQRQTQVTVGLFYTLIGKDRFGTVDWR
jgi:hypothetical protein